ncbi:hypothetical protein CUC15_09730 [Oceanobacillus zhaokaii]|uniref:Lipoprotein n=1 Tax=Oceanobacillus zhaokaii TaxID=2052660 RepID=A0A345PGR0_9BACI|nr:hypothetical protein [Oceanobacillus zhaokaii]AXI09190.1 hypothetical protein CUC15_09730 [Oceanobacillus zhaokaii]
MKKLLIILMFAMVLTACSQDSTSGGSYSMVVVINGIEYNGTNGNLIDYEIDEEIGRVSKKVEPHIFPENNQSNFYEEDSVIYSVKNETDFIIVENTKGEQSLLQKPSGSN